MIWFLFYLTLWIWSLASLIYSLIRWDEEGITLFFLLSLVLIIPVSSMRISMTHSFPYP